MKISIVIPTYNRRGLLQRALEALFVQDFPADEYEVIVVVDGATDGTAEMLRTLNPKCSLRVLETENRGPSAARNLGLSVGKGELVLMLDDDLIAVPELVRLHCEAHVAGKLRVVHGPIFIEPESAETIIRYVSEKFYEGYYHALSPEMELHYPDELAGHIAVLSSLANSSVPRQFLVECGGFDEQIRVAEDLEFGLRLWKAGASFCFLPNAVAMERYVKTTREYLQWQEKAFVLGELCISRRHPEYRPYCSLSTLAVTQRGKRWLRNVAMRFPVSPVPLLVFPLRFERRFYRSKLLRDAGVKLLQVAERMMRLRSGLKAVGSWEALENEFGKDCPALLYHRVAFERGDIDLGLTITPGKFNQQMNWLKWKGYTGVTSSQWLRWLREGAGLPEKPILITFDDAYAETAKYALPVLKRLGWGATVFTVTKELGGTNSWDRVRGSGQLNLMTAEQIQYWSKVGIEFGAHSRTHKDLTKLTADECEAEIAGSKSDLEALGLPVVAFAYPYGAQNETVRAIAQRYFSLSFSTEEGINYLQTDRKMLRRTYVGPEDSVMEFAMGMRNGRMQWSHRLRIRLALRTRLKRVWRALF